MNSAYIASIVNSTLRSTTPILLAALGSAMCSRVGVFNIALEAQMLIACFCSIVVNFFTGSTEVATCLRQGGRVSLVFGPEDRGLDNAAITQCHRLVCIPTDPAASSLNLAQAVLIVLYACAAAMREADRSEAGAAAGGEPHGPRNVPRPEPIEPASLAGKEDGHGPLASAADQERLMAALREMLLRIDYLHGDNPDYFLMPWRRLFGRARLRRHEYDALMGMCRQVRRALERKEG